jgi:ABC-2 type transport system permease protein
MSPHYQALSAEVAGKVVFMVFVIPATAILAVALRPEWHFSARAGVSFFPALASAWALRFFWGYWLALLAFWATRADGLLAIQDALVFLLGGLVAPTVSLPGALGVLAAALPFRYMVGFPVEVLLGLVDGRALLTGFCVQLGWLIVGVALTLALWRRGLRRYTAAGG